MSDILTILIVLLVIALLGGFTFHLANNILQALLVIIAVVVIIRVIQGRRVL